VEIFFAISKRAVARGEADPEKLVPPVIALIADLFRYQIIMNFAALSDDLQETWVDALPAAGPGELALRVPRA
jgi:hypothetical protein